MIRAVIFDFNGVLVDDEHVHFELFRAVLGEEGVTITARQYHEQYLGLDDRGCFEAALVEAGQAADGPRLDALIARKARRYVAVASTGLRYFPGAAACLTTLAAHWPLAINSGALRPEIEFALDRLACRAQVAAIVSAEDTTRCKPDPQGYLLALGELRRHGGTATAAAPALGLALALADLEPEQCVVVEDSLAGVASAKGAGMWAVGITHTYTAEALREAGADAVIDSLETLTPDWIAGRFAAVGVPAAGPSAGSNL
jgi:beta-phosphoglucomutase-like phosphatase (HAD superfamily)